MGGGLSAYLDALDYLFVRTTGEWRFGLERTAALLDALGNPHRALRCIHVGGTNGKGSVCAMLEAALRAGGLSVARYTSPHLVSFRERVLVNGAPVDEDAVVEFVREWTPVVERIGATFFEATTAMAFTLFARAKPDVSLIEVGLGGRLDATNVVEPLTAVVTSIGIDHTEYLGTTREAIAREKAGIFKPGRAAIIGEPERAIRDLLASLARAAGSSPVSVVHESGRIEDVRVSADGTRFVLHMDGRAITCHTSLVGSHQAANAATALTALAAAPEPLRIDPETAALSLSRVELPGRFQQRGKYVFDVAHNPAGAAVLAETIRAVDPPRPRVAVVSILGDKDWLGMLDVLAHAVDHLILTTAPTSPANRTWDAGAAIRAASEHGWPCVHEPDFDRALARADREGRTVIVTGSFHTVGDAFTRLHVSPFAG